MDGLKPGYKALNYIGFVVAAVDGAPVSRTGRLTQHDQDSTA